MVFHEAHVEGIEAGVHKITIPTQPGCNPGLVHVANEDQAVGPQTVSVTVPNLNPTTTLTIWVDVACVVSQ